jgi:hypothetical protein
MKIKFFLLLSVLAFPLWAQNNLALGQDLLQFMNKNPPGYKTFGPKILQMREGTIDFYKYSPVTTDLDLKILVVVDKYEIGVLQREDDDSVILLDMKGDGKLDTKFPILFVPYWVVAQNTPNRLKTNNNNVKEFLDGFYKAFQTDVNPYLQNGELDQRSSELLKNLENDNLENRDLIYTIFCYYRLGNAFPMQALEALNYLTDNYVSRFDSAHPLLFLYTVETLLNLGNIEGARGVLLDLLKIDPGFVPAQVYQWQLEQDKQEKERLYKQLKKLHPNHWIVVQI